jgi:predicted MPP superfamily phosphohydrolase
MILAQLSDLHIVAAGKLFRCPMQGTAPEAERARLEFDTAPYLARAVASLNALVPRPDVTVVTGDLVDHGEPEEYEQLRHLLAPLSMPVFVIPGNHRATSLRPSRISAFMPDSCGITLSRARRRAARSFTLPPVRSIGSTASRSALRRRSGKEANVFQLP